VGLAYVVMRLASIVADAAGVRRWWVRPLAAAAILFNPPIVFLSAVWGQVDTVAAFYALAGILLVVKPERSTRSEAAGAALLALAFATKPQTAFLLPVVALALVVRHLRGRKVELADVAVRLGTPLLAFLVVWLGLALPFGLGPERLFEFYGQAGSTYPWTSVWAFNLWGVAGFWRPDSGPDAFHLFGATALTLGIVLFVAAASYVMVRAYRVLARRPDAEVILAGGAALVCLSFALLTRIHERYLFLGLACLAPLVVYPRIRAAFAALSLLYMVNLYFPWVFYVEQAGRTTLKIDALFDFVYGTAQDSTQKKLLSAVTAALCIAVAARIWELAKARRTADPVEDVLPQGAPWKPGLHPIGRKGAALAGAVFLVVLPTRLIGLASPQEMYFDEIYHARTAGEYLQGREAYEYTHPPLGKELMALSIQAFGRWRAEPSDAQVPAGLGGGVADSDGTNAVWATPSPAGGAVLWSGALGKGCAFSSATAGLPLELQPAAIAVAPGGGAYVAGESGNRSVVARYSTAGAQWEARVDAPVVDLAAAGEAVYAVDEAGTLWRADSAGARALAGGAVAVSSDPSLGGVWAAFPEQRIVSAYDAGGTAVANPATQEGAHDVLVVPEADRVVAFDRETGLLETIDNQEKTWQRTLDTSGEAIAATPYQGLVYVIDGRDVEIVEPRALAFLGETRLPFEPAELLPATPDGALMAVGDRLACVTGNNFFAWRLPGALLGALVPALVFLLAIRCSGNLLVAALAAAFMALDGLAFAMARIATLDSQVTAHVVAAWLAALSVYFHAYAVARGDRRGDRRAGLVWLGATGLFLGLAVATKWVGVYSFGLIALVMIVDVVARRERGVGALFPGFGIGLAAVILAVGALPVGVYVLSYVPHMSLGFSLGDVARLQKSMYDYHSNLTAGHPYSSPWYGWPVGVKQVAMWSGTSGAETGVIAAIANPVLFAGGLWGLAVVALTAWRRRVLALAALPLAALTQYVPWIFVARAAFLYHYLPVVPFLAVALAWALVARPRRGTVRTYEPWVVLTAAAAVFAFMLPELDGWYTSQQFHDTLHGWFPWLF
ncbi:MAG TPA: phospholipid carrier-dependent glycosyltransferase, partial [Actinomycetota bacterium]|nr:phospholipid carrier-dependent glycosyltransferase [Actinomycetota bacterium]